MPNITSLGVCFKKNIPRQIWRICFIQRQIHVIYGVRFERRKVDKKQTYMKTETCNLYSRVFWIFLPNVIKIDPYNFEPYRFKVGAFSRHSVLHYFAVSESVNLQRRIAHHSWLDWSAFGTIWQWPPAEF